MKKLITLTAVCSAVLLAGCQSTPKASIETGTTNFKYQTAQKSKSTNSTIAIVAPQFQDSGTSSVNVSANNNVNFNQLLKSYEARLASSMGSSLNEIVISKGFKIAGPYSSFDEITYSDKKNAYLALVPELSLYVDKKQTSNECSNVKSYCEDVGTIQIGGSLNIKLIEPLTQETFYSKRINLSDLNAPQNYVNRWHQSSQSTSLVGLALSTAVNASMSEEGKEQVKLVNNTDKVLVDQLNEFYSKAMKMVDKHLSSQEIMSFAQDVKKVKENKRF